MQTVTLLNDMPHVFSGVEQNWCDSQHLNRLGGNAGAVSILGSQDSQRACGSGPSNPDDGPLFDFRTVDEGVRVPSPFGFLIARKRVLSGWLPGFPDNAVQVGSKKRPGAAGFHPPKV